MTPKAPFDAYFVDLEGTLVVDKRFQPIQGAVEWFNALSDTGARALLVTNNTTHTPQSLAEELSNVGFTLDSSDVISVLEVTRERLTEVQARTILISGNQVLEEYLGRAFEVRTSHEVDAVVLGLDLQLGYEKLKTAASAIVLNRARLLTLHANRLYMDVDGLRAPSVGAIARCLEYATNRQAEVMGKPEETYFRRAIERAGAEPSRTLMVSDDPFSDLAGARRLGLRTALVLSGKYEDRAIVDQIDEELRPEIIAESVAELTVDSLAERFAA